MVKKVPLHLQVKAAIEAAEEEGYEFQGISDLLAWDKDNKFLSELNDEDRFSQIRKDELIDILKNKVKKMRYSVEIDDAGLDTLHLPSLQFTKKGEAAESDPHIEIELTPSMFGRLGNILLRDPKIKEKSVSANYKDHEIKAKAIGKRYTMKIEAIKAKL